MLTSLIHPGSEHQVFLTPCHFPKLVPQDAGFLGIDWHKVGRDRAG